ncbi:hypothetical protein [Streptomyces sp. N35]|uniref:hypothetical protein n=1 Tax=Streptomyces sp. N35 TaxID=2795730 RepID=UPI0035ABB440
MTGTPAAAIIDRAGLDALIRTLTEQGRTVIGPTVRDGAVVLAELSGGDELPYGWGAELEAGRYRLVPRTDGAAFTHTAGPHSWKAYLHPEREKVWQADRTSDGEIRYETSRTEQPSYAFLGVRPCDLRAIALQDRVLTGGRFQDARYHERRGGGRVVAAGGAEPAGAACCPPGGARPPPTPDSISR